MEAVVARNAMSANLLLEKEFLVDVRASVMSWFVPNVKRRKRRGRYTSEKRQEVVLKGSVSICGFSSPRRKETWTKTSQIPSCGITVKLSTKGK